MIISGLRKTKYGESQPSDLVCPNCKEIGTTKIEIRSRYFHVFWIPVIPVGKTGLSSCSDCEHEIKSRKMPHDFKREYQNLKADKRPPLWQFVGLVLILILAYLVWERMKEDDIKDRGYLNSPQISDLYRYKTDSHDYSTYKVKGFTTDSISMYPNRFEVEKILRADKIEDDSCFSKEHFTIGRNEVLALYDSGIIYQIIRKDPIKTN